MRLTLALAHLGEDMAANPEITVLASHLESVAGVEVVSWSDVHTPGPAVDVVQVAWPEWLVDRRANPAALRAHCSQVVAALDEARRSGTRLSWVVNNIRPHEPTGGAIAEAFIEQFLERVDCVVAPAAGVLQEAVAAHPTLLALPQAIVRYGDLRTVYEVARAEPQAARRALALESTGAVGLCLGVMRPYKNLGLIARLFEESFARHGDRRLVIAGHPADPAVLAELRFIEARCVGLRVIARRLDEREVSLLVAASDVVIIGSHTAVNSSVANLAVSLGRPVLMPYRGAGIDLASELPGRAIMTYPGGLSGDILDRAFRSFDGRAAEHPASTQVPFVSWRRAADQLLTFYGDVVRLPRSCPVLYGHCTDAGPA